jgi:hypothetical protein
MKKKDNPYDKYRRIRKPSIPPMRVDADKRKKSRKKQKQELSKEIVENLD